jgi:hypothetical protein
MLARDWVLVTDGVSGQSRSALAAVRALAHAGHRSAVTVSGHRSIAAASRYCSRVVVTPTVDEPGYADAVRAETAALPYLTVLASSDAAIQALEAPGRKLLDKLFLAELARGVGLVVPPGRLFANGEALRAAAGTLDYPVVVKPVRRLRSGYRPAQRVESVEALRRIRHLLGPVIVQPLVDDEMHSVTGVMWEGELVVAVHQRHVRLWPRGCGDACYAVTTEPDERLEKGLCGLLADFDGVFQAEFAGSCLLDLNPRVYGSLPLAVAAGANPVGAWCALLRGEDVAPMRARPGVEYRWLEGDVRHVAARWRSGELSLAECARALRPMGAASTRAQALRDPLPSLERGRYTSRVIGARMTGDGTGRHRAAQSRAGLRTRCSGGETPDSRSA